MLMQFCLNGSLIGTDNLRCLIVCLHDGKMQLGNYLERKTILMSTVESALQNEGPLGVCHAHGTGP